MCAVRVVWWTHAHAGKLAEFLDTAISFKMGRIKPSEFHAMFFTVASKATEDQAQAANQAKDAMEELEGNFVPCVPRRVSCVVCRVSCVVRRVI
jgi:hypothetical protein